MPTNISLSAYKSTVKSPYKIGNAQLLFTQNANSTQFAYAQHSALKHSMQTSFLPFDQSLYMDKLRSGPIIPLKKRHNRASSIQVDCCKIIMVEPLCTISIRTTPTHNDAKIIKKGSNNILNHIRAKTSDKKNCKQYPWIDDKIRYSSPMFRNQLIKDKIATPLSIFASRYRSKLSMLFGERSLKKKESRNILYKQSSEIPLHKNQSHHLKGRIILNIPLVANSIIGSS